MEQTSARPQEGPTASLRTFLLIWIGQLISTLGSGLTGFALGVYVYQETGSATQLGLSLLAAVLPYLLFSPLAGALVDRWDRRWAMLLSDTGAGLSTLVIWLLLSSGNLEVWHIYAANAANSLFGALQRPAYMAATSLLIPKEHYGRASGLVQLGGALSQILSPALAGFLIAAIDIQGVVLIDFATYAIATATLLVIRIPRPEPTSQETAGRRSLLHDAGFGWVYIRQRPGLLGMLTLFAICNFALGFYAALLTPMILSFSSTEALGTILSVGGIGMLVGSLVMSTWGGSRRKIDSLVGSIFLAGICVGLVGLQADPLLIAIAIFCFFFLIPIANGSSQAIWLAKVAPDVQGRVFSVRAMLASIASPLAYLLAGPLADQVFEPLMMADGALAPLLGPVLSTGPGRGIGLIFLAMGLLISLSAAIGYLAPSVRYVEDRLPDHTPTADVLAPELAPTPAS